MKTISQKQNLAQKLRPFENKWVALVDNKVVASGESPKEVRMKAEKAGYKHFSFYLVPSFSASFIP